MGKTELTAERLRELLRYDPETGQWTRIAPRRGYRIGQRADKRRKDGYFRVGVDMKRYLSHRLAWLYMTGAWPLLEVDHRDGDPSNNRWDNLRPADSSQQSWNAVSPKGKLKGFTRVKRDLKKPYQAQIMVRGKHKFLGMFATEKEAHEAYVQAAKEHFGEFARGA